MPKPVVVSISHREYGSLRKTAQGVIKGDEGNAMEAIRCTPFLSENIYYDEFRCRTMVTSPLPWDSRNDHWKMRTWTDHDSVKTAEFFQISDIPIKSSVIQTVIHSVARESARHPLREWLSSLEWDGLNRIQSWLPFYMGAVVGKYNARFVKAVGAAWLISAVARVFEPGCKADHLLILEGAQGVGKSTSLKVLAGEEYFTDHLPDLGSTDCALQLQGSWIIELSELENMSRSEVGRFKAFMTHTADKYRPKYGRETVHIPRQCVFAGTTNEDEYLKDFENRRIWPIRVTSCDIDAIAEDRAQLWAEAVARYKAGEAWWLQRNSEDDEAIEQGRSEQEARVKQDPWYVPISDYLKTRDDVSIEEILREGLGIPLERWSMSEKTRIGFYLKKQGRVWEKYRAKSAGREWRYRRRPASA